MDMKWPCVLIAACLLPLWFSDVPGESIAGYIDLTSDLRFYSHQIPNNGYFSIYVVAKTDISLPDSAFRAVEFFVDMSEIPEAFLLREEYYFDNVWGSYASGSGVQVGLDRCVADWRLTPIGRLYFYIPSPPGPLEGTRYVRVVKSTLPTNRLAFAMCDEKGSIKPAGGSGVAMNGTDPTPTKLETWGRIKAFYRDESK
jgi:hypothetical protein